MNVRTALLVFMGAGALAVACGGKIDGSDPSGSGSLQSKAGQNDNGGTKQGSVPGSTSGNQPGSSVAIVPPTPPTPTLCSYNGSSASGGPSADGNATCMSDDQFICGPRGAQSESRSISCNCVQNDGVWVPGSCTCGGATIPFSCAQGCAPGPAEHAACKIQLDGG